MPSIGVVGATGAVGRVTLALLAERGFEDVRAFASAKSAGRTVPYGDRPLEVEEATPEALAAGGLDLCFFSVGTGPSQTLVPPAVAAGAICIDKSDAYRLAEGVPLVVAGVNDDVLNGNEIVANPNCSAIQLACVLKPLHDAAGLARVRLATYQSMSGAGDAGIQRLRETAPMEGDLAMDWELEGAEFTLKWFQEQAVQRLVHALGDLLAGEDRVGARAVRPRGAIESHVRLVAFRPGLRAGWPRSLRRCLFGPRHAARSRPCCGLAGAVRGFAVRCRSTARTGALRRRGRRPAGGPHPG